MTTIISLNGLDGDTSCIILGRKRISLTPGDLVVCYLGEVQVLAKYEKYTDTTIVLSAYYDETLRKWIRSRINIYPENVVGYGKLSRPH